MFKFIFLGAVFSLVGTSNANIFDSIYHGIKKGVNTVAHATGIDKVAGALGLNSVLKDVDKIASGGISLIGHPEKSARLLVRDIRHPKKGLHILALQFKDLIASLSHHFFILPGRAGRGEGVGLGG